MGQVWNIIRYIFRFLFFLIGLAAIVAVIGVGVLMVRNNAAGTNITLAEGAPSIGHAPTDPEELAIYVMLQSRADEINAPVSDDATEVDFTIEPGESALAVAQKLEAEGLVSDANLFRQFLRYNKLDASLEAGDYILRRNMNMMEIGQALQKAIAKEVVITIPEGWRAEEIADMLTNEGVMDGDAFLQVVRDGTAVESNILFDRPSGQSYEGYLFPDTYRLPVNATPEDLIDRMLDNLASKLPANAIELAASRGLKLYDVLTVASIVEREAVFDDERPIIASVYLNRLQQGMYLQADPTVQYAMGYQPDSGQWWNTPVTLDEYSGVDSPYTTYLNPGLPPGPIANPGINSILAVLEPADTNFLFFVAYGEGRHIFAETYEEHQKNVAVYQGQ